MTIPPSTDPSLSSPLTPARRRTILTLDWLVLILLTVTVALELTGGFFTYVGGIRVSAREVDRPFIAALVLIGFRLLLSRDPAALGVSAARWRLWRDRLYAHDADEPRVAEAFSWTRLVWAALGLCAVGAVLLAPQLRHMRSVPDLGDPLFSMWRMGWVSQQILGDPRPLFDANIFHPEPLTFTYSDSMLLPAATAAPLLSAGVPPAIAYNILFLSGFFLSGLAAYVLMERLTGSAAAAFISALIFGFYPYHFEHYSHLELQMMQWMPLALLALHEFVRGGRLRHAMAAALCVVAQLYSSMYYAVFFVLYGGVVMGVLMASRRPPLRRVLAPAALAGVTAIALAVPLARPYVAATRIKGEREVIAVRIFSARASDYLRAHRRSTLYGTLTLPGRQTERALFPGIVPLALAGAGLASPIGVTRLACLAGGLLAFDGSLGFNGLTYPYLYKWFMPIRSLRVPARFSVLVALSLAVFAGFGARRLLSRTRSASARRIVFAGLIVAATLDVWPSLELEPVWPEPPPIYAALAGTRSAVLAEFPLREDPFAFADNTPYMYFSMWHWNQMVNGYSGFIPAPYEELVKGVRGFPDAASFETLRARGVTHLTVNCAFYRDGCEELLTILDGLPFLRKTAEGRWQGRPVRLYELLR